MLWAAGSMVLGATLLCTVATRVDGTEGWSVVPSGAEPVGEERAGVVDRGPNVVVFAWEVVTRGKLVCGRSVPTALVEAVSVFALVNA